jgi:hypothetical protein
VESLPAFTSADVIILPVKPLRIRMPGCARWVMPIGAAKPGANFVESSRIG